MAPRPPHTLQVPDTTWVTSGLYNPVKLEHNPNLPVKKLRLAEAPGLVNGRIKDIARSSRGSTAPRALHKPELTDSFSRICAKTGAEKSVCCMGSPSTKLPPGGSSSPQTSARNSRG